MSIGRDDYQERKEARVERLEERADKARAASAASNTAIRSDDPDAVEKLEAKLAAMQAAQERDKARNAWYRKHKTMKGCPGITDEDAAEADAELSALDAQPYSSGHNVPVPAWVLSNRNGEMKRIKDRLAQLRKVDEMEHTEIEFDGGTIITNEDVNRVQILFDEKPDDATRSNLKGYGFRWSKTERAWQALRTPQNLRRACYALGIDPPKPTPAPQPDPDQATDHGGGTAQDTAPSSAEDNTDGIQTAADGQALFPFA